MRYLAKVAYDGTNFSGWQIQKNARTVQGEIEAALFRIAKQKIPIVAAGRTDAGVHALGQYFHFDLLLNMTTVQIKLALQSQIDPDVKILQIYKVTDNFHARYQAYRRTYKYFIGKQRTPFNRLYRSFFPHQQLDVSCLQSYASFFLGKHDFISFRKFNPEIKSTICDILEFTVEETKEDIVITISADRFLHNMVRRIVGTIINLNKDNKPPELIPEFFEAKTPENKLISTAPPQGLFLFDVEYPIKYFL